MKFFDIFRKKETRSQDVSWSALSALGAGASGNVNHRMAESLATVYACVQAIASSVASIPCYVYRETENGRDVVLTHPLAKIIRRGPNRHQTWPDFVEWLLASALLRGNALVEIVTDGAGRVVALQPHPWENVSVQLLKGNKLAYDVTGLSSIYGGTGRQRRLLEHEVIHVRDRSDDGLVGRSRIQRAAAVFQGGLDVQESAAALHRNGLSPSGAFKTPHKMGPDAKAYMAKLLRDTHAGASNRGRFLILDDGSEWQSMSMTPEDAELLESRRFSVEELCRIMGCPPPLIQDYTHNTFTNAETAGRWFAQFTIAPWCRKIEAEFTRSVFSAATRDSHSLEFDLSGFLRGDHEARWKAHVEAVKAGILTVNEVREIEGWNPRQDGEKLQVEV